MHTIQCTLYYHQPLLITTTICYLYYYHHCHHYTTIPPLYHCSERSEIDEPSPPKKDSKVDSDGNDQGDPKTGGESSGVPAVNKVHR